MIDLKHLPPAVAKMLAKKELERRGLQSHGNSLIGCGGDPNDYTDEQLTYIATNGRTSNPADLTDAMLERIRDKPEAEY
jgi:hypothetical protein